MKLFVEVFFLACVFKSFVVFGDSAEFKNILVVVHGGYSSCGDSSSPKGLAPFGTGLYQPFLQVKNTLEKKGFKADWIVGCFDDVAPPSGEGKFVSSRAPSRLQYGDASQLRREIEAFTDAHPDLPVFLIGHSYGAWTAMYLAETLRANVVLAALATLDPISPKCGATQVIFGSEVCHQAPRDLANGKIRGRLNKWLNFYQTQDSWLTSSAIAEAENFLMKYRGPHTQIDGDPRVWQKIEQTLSTILRAN